MSEFSWYIIWERNITKHNFLFGNKPFVSLFFLFCLCITCLVFLSTSWFSFCKGCYVDFGTWKWYRNCRSILEFTDWMSGSQILPCRTRLNLFSQGIIPRTLDFPLTFSLPLGLVVSRRICVSIWRTCHGLSWNNRNQHLNQNQNQNLVINLGALVHPIQKVLVLSQIRQVLMKVKGAGREGGDEVMAFSLRSLVSGLCIS